MSRVGKNPIRILQGVKVDIKGNQVKVEGPKSKLSYVMPEGINAKVDNGSIIVSKANDTDTGLPALHGLARTLIHNMVQGVHTGYTRELDIVGVGFKAATKGNTLTLIVGYSHPVEYEMPLGVQAKVENNTRVIITGADKMLVGMVASQIRAIKEPEPYQGKGIKYVDERIIRKQGKAATGSSGGGAGGK